MMKGKIHSIETMGLVDGPGIRVVVFFQGCSLRCAYCHNPDTWNFKGGEEIEALDLIKKISRYKSYFDKSGGGVTFSGGDPLMQPKFLLEVLKLCKENGIKTALDTSGYGLSDYDEILKYTDLVLFDIKNVSEESYLNLTGKDGKESWRFLHAVEKSNAKIWIRHVVIPGITDSIEHITELSKLIKSIKNVEKVELLPYHTLGLDKYKSMDIKYKLEGIEPMDKDKCKELESKLTALLNL
ncbi:pyruvate formate-lyase-activating protein [Clostridium algidicarnis]|uniref:pyruvate formate-lyase-activating protein n=1 Tax=Clostridium algidicarnis TaxID=37659 RepID=UPI000497B7EE|nr:pyruvate formate-lyase-activating protein [Clostridium algidicarnis]